MEEDVEVKELKRRQKEMEDRIASMGIVLDALYRAVFEDEEEHHEERVAEHERYHTALEILTDKEKKTVVPEGLEEYLRQKQEPKYN